ncbi:GAF domain-containing protein [Pseudorhodoferax sp. Leaf267]|uniref:GAF domain-containing protein n=1 Tax=Pseudorhodoferax sp. Leaf267 TaxID=1736316 RepID=UPI0006FDE9DA|nr:GAF domain-containing protein [Pseudorhodoferax sp. Leaf267]KQP22001.1 hypothetical protein ASF43_24440 [Pseudorhodoferax sp. Leaf267]
MGYSKEDIPDHFMRRWQDYADLMAKAANVPAALVMRVWPEQIEVLVASVSDGNPYDAQEMSDLGTGLYCETVMSTRQMLSVPDALSSPAWAHNPDVALGMVCYLGLPLVWPDDSIFGTVCILDTHAGGFSAAAHTLLQQLKNTIEADFRAIGAPDGDDGHPELASRFEASARAMAGGR